jgi:hypothetical protein
VVVLEAVLQLPAEVLAPTAVAAGVTATALIKMLDAVKRVAGFPAELRFHHTKQQAAQLRGDANLLDAKEAEARAVYRRRQLHVAGWRFDRVVVTDDDYDVL